MNNKEFIASIEKTYRDGVELIRKKNADYAVESNPFKNFEGSVFVGVPIEKGILIRILDKIVRVANLLDKKPDVLDESVEDSLLDAINYLSIFKAYLESKGKRK